MITSWCRRVLRQSSFVVCCQVISGAPGDPQLECNYDRWGEGGGGGAVAETSSSMLLFAMLFIPPSCPAASRHSISCPLLALAPGLKNLLRAGKSMCTGRVQRGRGTAGQGRWRRTSASQLRRRCSLPQSHSDAAANSEFIMRINLFINRLSVRQSCWRPAICCYCTISGHSMRCVARLQLNC